MGKSAEGGKAGVGEAEGIGSESASTLAKEEEQRHDDGDDKPEVGEKALHQVGR